MPEPNLSSKWHSKCFCLRLRQATDLLLTRSWELLLVQVGTKYGSIDDHAVLRTFTWPIQISFCTSFFRLKGLTAVCRRQEEIIDVAMMNDVVFEFQFGQRVAFDSCKEFCDTLHQMADFFRKNFCQAPTDSSLWTNRQDLWGSINLSKTSSLSGSLSDVSQVHRYRSIHIERVCQLHDMIKTCHGLLHKDLTSAD